MSGPSDQLRAISWRNTRMRHEGSLSLPASRPFTATGVAPQANQISFLHLPSVMSCANWPTKPHST